MTSITRRSALAGMAALATATAPALALTPAQQIILLSGPSFPRSLFKGGAQGAWYDPSDLSTLFQDSAGTTTVTADGDPVGKMVDKSGNGFHLTQATAAARPLYKTSGGLRWLLFDGVDDALTRTDTLAFRAAAMGLAAAFQPGTVSRNDLMGCGNSVAFATNNWIMSNGGTFDIYGRTPASVLSSGSISSGSDYVGLASCDGSNIRRRLSGGAAATTAGTFGTDSAQGFALGIPPAGSVAFTGRCYGVLIRNLAWSGAEEAAINTFLGAKAGLVL